MCSERLDNLSGSFDADMIDLILIHCLHFPYRAMSLPGRTEDGGNLGFSSEKQKNEDRNVLIIAEKSIDKMGGVV